MQHWDTIIVGGGVIGSAIAYFLAADPQYTGSILVLEKDPTYAAGSTALSAGGFRQQFTIPENIQISHFSIAFMDEVARHLQVDDQVPDIAMVRAGYLFLAGDKGRPVLAANHALQQAHGVVADWMEPDALARRFPWLSLAGISAGTIGRDEGWLDAYSLLQAFRRKAISLGATYRQTQVTGLLREGNRVTGVQTAEGDTLLPGAVVNAVGPRAPWLCDTIGIDLPVRPRKRFVYHFTCPEPIPNCPMLIDTSGVYVRPEGEGFICGISPPADQDPDCLDLEIDETLFQDVIWPALAHRVPAFETLRLGKTWAGHYAYNTVDQNAVLGPHPEVLNFYFANGFSGHGLQQSPAVGRALSEWITHGHCTTLDLSRFGYPRFAENRLLIERNVI